MPALNFKKQFAECVKNGKKKQTIRAKRKFPIKEGDILYLYTGMRTKNCTKLKQVVCYHVHNIEIRKTGDVLVDGVKLNIGNTEVLARLDGFINFDEMYDFFRKTHGFRFLGQIIHWRH